MERQKTVLGSIVIAALLYSTPGFSGDALDVSISRLTVLNGHIYIKVQPSPPVRASCSTSSSWHYTYPLSEQESSATLSMALAAYTANLIVSVRSKDICTNVSSMEDLDWLVLEEL